MALTNARVGSRLKLILGTDKIPARIVGTPTVEFDANNRPVQVAPIVMFKTTKGGEQILQERMHRLYFSFDRSERVVELDGTAEEPLAVSELIARASASLEAWLMAKSVQEVDADELPI